MATEPTTVAEPKYTPRTAAADFTKSLPQLGVDTATTETTTETKIVEQPKTEVKTDTSTETKAETKASPVEEKIPRTQKDWESYKAKQKEREAARESEFTALQTKIKELESKPNPTAADDTRLKALETEREELSEKLRMVDVTSHPKFKAYYEGKTNAQIELAKRIAGSDKADAIAKALALPDGDFRQEKIDSLMADMSPRQVAQIGGVLNSLAEIELDRAAQIEKSKTDYVAYQEQAKQKAETQKTESVKKAEAMFTGIVSAVQNPKDKDGLFIFQKRDGDEEWNKGVDERLKFAKSILFDTHPPETLMKTALNAAALPGVVKSYQLAQARIAELEAQVAGLTASQPTLQRGAIDGGGDGGKQKPAERKGGRFLDGRGQAADWIKSTAELQTQE